MQLYGNKNSITKLVNANISNFSIYCTPNYDFNEEFDMQLELSDIATEIIKAEGNTYPIPVQKPFYKLGDYADTFIKQDNKWYEQHYIKEHSLTGEDDELWFLQNSGNGFYKYQWSQAFSNKLNTKDTVILCNYFKQITTSQSNAVNIEGIANGIYPDYSLMIVTNKITSLVNFKAKLKELYDAGTPVKVYYILATPELIECTSEQTQILEQIIKDGTYKEVTHFYTKEDLKPTIELTYYKDLETLFNKQAELENTLNNVQAQILELGGK